MRRRASNINTHTYGSVCIGEFSGLWGTDDCDPRHIVESRSSMAVLGLMELLAGKSSNLYIFNVRNKLATLPKSVIVDYA